MGDWSGARNALVSGYEVGRASGGRMSGLGSVIAKVADRLRSQREQGEAMSKQQNILGMEEASKIRQLEKEGDIKSRLQKEEYGLKPVQPIEWKPTSKEEALSFEEAKAGLKKGLTLSNALGILSDPMKAYQLKKKYPNLYKEAEDVVRANLGEDVLGGLTPKLPGKITGKLPSKIVPEAEDIMDTNW